jgi:hypothetical protein
MNFPLAGGLEPLGGSFAGLELRHVSRARAQSNQSTTRSCLPPSSLPQVVPFLRHARPVALRRSDPLDPAIGPGVAAAGGPLADARLPRRRPACLARAAAASDPQATNPCSGVGLAAHLGRNPSEVSAGAGERPRPAGSGRCPGPAVGGPALDPHLARRALGRSPADQPHGVRDPSQL